MVDQHVLLTINEDTGISWLHFTISGSLNTVPLVNVEGLGIGIGQTLNHDLFVWLVDVWEAWRPVPSITVQIENSSFVALALPLKFHFVEVPLVDGPVNVLLPLALCHL